MRVQPASKLPCCPTELNGAHQGPYVHFNSGGAFKLCEGNKTGWGILGRFNPDSNYDINAIYVGGLHEYNPEGHGQLHIQAAQYSYIGGWRENVASGWGKWCDSWTEEWPDGPLNYKEVRCVNKTMTYEGGFKEGYFHGYGELRWENGANYKGSWNEGRRHGCGMYTTAGGDEGYWWEAEVNHGHGSPDKSSVPANKYHDELKRRKAAEKNCQEEHDKRIEITAKHDKLHLQKVELERKLKVQHEELDKETQRCNDERTAREVAEAQLKLWKEHPWQCNVV